MLRMPVMNEHTDEFPKTAEDELRREDAHTIEDEVMQRTMEQGDEREAEARDRVVDGGLAGTTCLASINVTHLENNAHFVLSRPGDIIAIQEHKLSAQRNWRDDGNVQAEWMELDVRACGKWIQKN